jgi:peptidyl-prolyl cis-trans isomerase B (cyclophilin B)
LAGKKDRDRRRARERYERQREERLQRRQKIRQRASIGGAVVLVLGLIAGLTIAFAGGGSPKASSSPTAKATPTKSATATATPSATATTPPPVAEPAHHCTYTAGGNAAKKVTMPPAAPDYKATYTATINTNVGKIEIALLNSKATCTVNSFVHLASADFWNASQCHRVTTSGIYVLQCGDPFAKAADKLTCSTAANSPGTGGPGYQFDNENLTGATYPSGTVAMANSGTGPNGSGTNGSQFFLVYKNTTLPPQYTPFGTITSGLDILQKVANAGTSCTYGGPGDGAPKEKVIIDSVTIKKT